MNPIARKVTLITLITLMTVAALAPLAAAKLGDDQFAQAIESMLMSVRSETQATLAATNAPFVRVHDCIYNAENYKLPPREDIDPASTLGKVLARSAIKVGVQKYEIYKDSFSTIFSVALKKLKERYVLESDIDVQITEVESNSVLADGLISGIFDVTMPGFYVGGFDPARRRLREIRPLCSPAALEFSFLVRNIDGTPEYGTVEDLMNTARTSAKKIIVYSQDAKQIIQQSYGSTVNVKIEDQQKLEILTEAQDCLGAFLGTIVSNEELVNSNVSIVKGHFALPVLAFTREERKRNFLAYNEEMVPFHSGNSQLRSIFDSAIWNLQVGNVNQDLTDLESTITIGDCVTNVPAQPKETISEGVMKGTLLNIANTKQIRIGYVETNNAPLITVSKDKEPAGAIYQIEKKVIKKLSEILGSTLTIAPVVYSTVDDLFSALKRGKIDVTSTSLLAGASVASEPRRWQYEYSCSPVGWQITLFAKPTYTSLQQLKDASSTNAAKFACSSEAMRDVLRDLFGKEANIVIMPSEADAAAAVLDSSSKFIAYLPEFSKKAPKETTAIQTSQYMSGTFFFRKDSILGEPSNFEDQEDFTHLYVGSAVIITFIVVLLIFGLVGMIVFLLYPKLVKSGIIAKTKARAATIFHPMEDIFEEENRLLEKQLRSDDDEDPEEYQQVSNKRNSVQVGDAKDPDYVSPEFK